VPTALPEDPSPTTVSEVGTPAPGATESGVNSAPPHYTVLLTKAQQNGSVRIIIGLQVPFVPEGNLPDEAAVTAQRKAIADAQDALLRRLAGHNTQNVITFEYAPFIAMDVDSAALSQLIVDPEVSSIEEDGLSSPSLSGPGQ
jgi:hypothetical protein